MSSPTRTIVHIGLGDAPPNSQYTDGEVQDLVRQGVQKAHQAGYSVDLTFIMANTIKTDMPNVLTEVKTKIANAKPDAVVFGGGIKMTPQFLEFFEAVVNIARETSPASKMGFQGRPDDMLEVCERLFK